MKLDFLAFLYFMIVRKSSPVSTGVTTAIRRSLEEIAKHHPELGCHLEESLTLGRSLSYRPASETDWLTD